MVDLLYMFEEVKSRGFWYLFYLFRSRDCYSSIIFHFPREFYLDWLLFTDSFGTFLLLTMGIVGELCFI